MATDETGLASTISKFARKAFEETNSVVYRCLMRVLFQHAVEHVQLVQQSDKTSDVSPLLGKQSAWSGRTVTTNFDGHCRESLQGVIVMCMVGYIYIDNANKRF